jgi:hypothetical protein
MQACRIGPGPGAAGRHEQACGTEAAERSLAAHCARDLATCPRKARGRREGRVLAAPMAACKKARGSHHRFSRDDPAFPARWVYGCSALSPGTGCLAPVARALVKACANLASAPGCQDHTGWPSAKAHRTRHDIGEPDPSPPNPRATHRSMSLVRQHRRSHRSPPHVRDDRETPLSSRRNGWIETYFLIKRNRIFAAERLDGEMKLQVQQKIVFGRRRVRWRFSRRLLRVRRSPYIHRQYAYASPARAWTELWAAPP